MTRRLLTNPDTVMTSFPDGKHEGRADPLAAAGGWHQ
jgi:hypothetical protein